MKHSTWEKRKKQKKNINILLDNDIFYYAAQFTAKSYESSG